MKFLLRFISAFILTAAIYYSIITHINYGLPGFSLIRLVGFALSGLLFFLAIRNIPWINRLAHKMRLNRIERHGIIVMAFLLSVAQFVLADELSSLYHGRLLDESSQLATAWVVDCERNYCDFQYEVANRVLEQKVMVPDDELSVGDSLQIHYHLHNPNIFRLAQSSSKSLPK